MSVRSCVTSPMAMVINRQGLPSLNHAQKKLFEQNFFSFDKRRVHDLRGTARTMLGKMGFDDSLAKRCLNQQARNRVDEIYNRHAYFEERKATHAKLGEWRAPIVNGSETNKIVDFDTVCKS